MCCAGQGMCALASVTSRSPFPLWSSGSAALEKSWNVADGDVGVPRLAVLLVQVAPVSVVPEGQSGEQMQQPTGWKPARHFGYAIAPYISQPWELALVQRRSIPLLLRPSPNF